MSNFNKKKYYNEDDFLRNCAKFNQRTNVSPDILNERQETAYDSARKSIIKMLEEKYIDLEMEIDSSQGAMNGLDEAFEELNIYKTLIALLGEDVESHKQELVEDWFNKRKEENTAIKPIKFKVIRTINDINDLNTVVLDIYNVIDTLINTTNEIIKKLK